MDGWFSLIVQLQPNYFAFVSGISISIGTKLALGIALEDYRNKFGTFIILPTSLFLIAGFAFIIFSWSLEGPHIKWKTISRDLWPEDEIRRVALDSKAFVLWFWFLVGIGTFIGGLFTLFR